MSTIDNLQLAASSRRNARMSYAKFAELRQVRTRYLESALPTDAACVVFIHGGIAFVDTLGMSANLWEHNIGAIAPTVATYSYDVPDHSHPAIATLDDVVEHARALIDHTGFRQVHLVGHGDGGIVALKLALGNIDAVSSVTVVGSNAAPLGDAVADFTISDPPAPLASRHAQRWLAERLSHSEHHLGVGGYLDEAVDAAARRADASDALRRQRMRASVARARAEIFARCRDGGVSVPVMLVCGFQDPIVSPKHALALFEILSERTSRVQLRFVNRAGNMPFRERPDEFNAAIAGFVGALQGPEQ
ncbi:alpha/beta hydrolase [Burkholderia cepacia]|uniref:Alpha/beta hydrolase n=1 Tax=Burkholderia contaminans TaxID=488447 RepID=A0A3N8RZL2_9BURK|nr:MULTISPECIES: alpha/beta hydrolase [Burkholderia cepacia complex]RQT37456.1 alpha/beta hydrolase [Burkholderia contaminans]RRA19442.1 alpha/beta hydrolase [Burkholderia cepacia]